MISSPILYLFSLAFIVALFSLSEQKLKLNIFKYIPLVARIYIFNIIIAYLNFFDTNEEIDTIYNLTTINLLPAMIFLMLLQVDFKQLFTNKIGCACTIGTKRYWLLILLALIVSFISQTIALKIEYFNNTFMIILFAALLGIFASFTKLKTLNGANEVANSMLYMFVALLGSKTII